MQNVTTDIHPVSVLPLLAGTHVNQLSVGDVSIAVKADHAVRLPSSLEPFRTCLCDADIDVKVEWLPQLSCSRILPIFDSGRTWKLYECEVGLQFDFYSPPLGNKPFKRLLIDEAFTTAKLLISEECIARLGNSIEPLGYPLDELLIMHRLTQEKAIELHSTGIVRPNGEANLFVGHSGAGKSTTTRLWTAVEDVEVLSDDRIIVRRDDKQIPRFARNDSQKYKMRMYGTPWHGEAMFASPNSAPLTRIFVLEHGHGNVITRMSPSQAVAELFARSFVPFHRHDYVDSALTFLEELVDAVPVYHYAFEPDQGAVDKILHFHD